VLASLEVGRRLTNYKGKKYQQLISKTDVMKMFLELKNGAIKMGMEK